MNFKPKMWKRLLALLLMVGMFLSSSATIAGAAVLGNGIKETVEKALSKLQDVTGLFGNDHFRDKAFNEKVLKNLDPNGKYWIFVDLEGESISEVYDKTAGEGTLIDFANSETAAEIRRALTEKQEAFLAELDASGIEYTYKHSYTLLSNAVAVQVACKDMLAVRKLSGVKSVSVSEHYNEPKALTTNDARVWGTGIYKTEGIPYNGNGLVVAVLDTGLDSSHAAFGTMPTLRPWVEYLTKEKVERQVFSGTAGGLHDIDNVTTPDDVYYNSKVPFAYDYADKDAVVYPSYSTHGVHVAGIIAGNLGDAENEPIKDSDGNLILGDDGQPLTFRGVAPEAQLVICKVFTDREDSESLGGAETVDILAALEDCVKLGVDVINMSLGSSCGFSTKDDDRMDRVYSSIRASGISLVVAASNDYSSAYGSNSGTNLTENPDSATVGAPSTFEEALSVASISGQKSPYLISNKGKENESYIFFTEASDGNSNQKEFVKELLEAKKAGADDELTVEYALVGLYGRTAGYTGIDVSGKIAVIQRGGEMTFEEKVSIAKMHGAIGCMIYNNVSGIIRMSIGNSSAIPTCSITMDAAQAILNGADPRTKTGTITLKKSQVAGPFMSDFSSWGPTPSLRLKPEITAHGGEITSAVPGGWDEYSGTSMAAPNMAGAMALVLQYLNEKHPELNKNDRLTLANRLVMSATTIAYDEFGTPYSPRKQGAGLATIKNAIETPAYIRVPGIDKTKLELGDDKTKTGVYNLAFELVNYGTVAKTYRLSSLTMTETVASDGKTVAEHAYMLDSLCTFVYTVNGNAVSDGLVTVAPGQTLSVEVKVTLGDAARQYLDRNFKNGMYVEGFVTLTDTAESGGINLSVPWLAFYGDWNAAPMFDLSAYDVARAEQDDSIPDEEKPQASVYPTIPLGSYYNSKYIIPLGSYLYEIPEGMNKVIYADEDKVAISMYDETNHRTVYKLYAVYAGLLRGASTMDIAITDTVTGEVLYEELKVNVRKAYSGGSTTARASLIELDIDPAALGLANNRKYQFEMVGQMSGVLSGEAPAARPEDSFRFTFYVDNEAPEIVDYRVRFDAYKDGKETKYKVYLDVDVYDNHYAQALGLCYLNVDENELALLTGDMIPIESARGGVTTVTVDITDYYESGKDIYLQVDDYALNTRAYRLSEYKELAEVVNYPTSVSFTDGEAVTIDRNEAKLLDLTVAPADAAKTGLYWTTSDKKVVQVKDGTIFGVQAGTAIVTVYAGPNASTAVKKSIKVTVTENLATKNIKLKNLTFDLIYNGDSELVDPTNNYVDVNPNMVFRLDVNANPWYFTGELDIRFSSSAPDVATVEETTGVVHTLHEGVAFITATQYSNGRPTASTVTAKLTVGPDFDVRSGTLYAYHGLGGKVTIPKSLNVYYIREEAFKDNNNITELEISGPCTEIQLAAFDHMTALERVVIPDTVSFVATGAFRNCPKLKQVDLRSRAITFSTRCFENCTSLENLNNLVVTDKTVDTKTANILDLSDSQFVRTAPHIGTLGSYAFLDCTALKVVDLTLLRVSGESVFYGCTSLEKAILSKHTAIGNSMFEGCSALSELEFTDTGKFDFSGILVPFSGCHLTTFTFPAGAETYFRDTDGVFYTDEMRTTLVFAPQNLGSFTAPDSLKTILPGAFAGSRVLSRVTLNGVETIGDYAFADCAGKDFKSVTVPASVTSMGAGVFYGCSYLNSADVQAKINTLPAYTFALSGLQSVTLGKTITALGDRSFYFTDFVRLDLTQTAVTTLGNYVFGNPYRLKSAKLPALTSVGYGTFAHVPDTAMTGVYPLEEVSFAAGTTDIGSGTFYGTSGYPNLKTVTLPDSVRNSVTAIGDNTFRGCSALTSLNLGALTSVGNNAFRGCTNLGKNGNTGFTTAGLTSVGSAAFDGCAALTGIDLSAVQTIGARAFRGTALTQADLSECRAIGDSAFAETPLQTVNGLTKLEKLGSYAFAKTGLTGTFTFPATLSSSERSIGFNPFYGTAITEIVLAGENSRYFVRDGVLYSYLAGGVQLEVYPAAKSGATFTIPDDVIRVGEDAFRGSTVLNEVVFPGKLLAIGDKAFFDNNVKSYVFTGLTAPVLEAYAFRNTDSEDTVLQKIFDFRNGEGEEKYYANFKDYLAKTLYSEKTGVKDLGLTVSYPKNAAGFDTHLWGLYFTTVNKTDTLPEPDTEAAIAAIAAIPTAEEIRALKTMTDREAAKALLTTYRERVSAARVAYNRVTNSEQQAFVTDAANLFGAESAIREVRTAFGETVRITELQVKTSPNKLVYVDGEMFDATGIELIVIYDDGSRDQVNEGLVLPTTPLKAGQQTVTFSYAGVSKTISVTVNRKPNENPPTPGEDPDTPNAPGKPDDPKQDEKKNTGLIVTLCVVGGVVVVGAAAFGVVMGIRKKGTMKTTVTVAPESAAESKAANDAGDVSDEAEKDSATDSEEKPSDTDSSES